MVNFRSKLKRMSDARMKELTECQSERDGEVEKVLATSNEAASIESMVSMINNLVDQTERLEADHGVEESWPMRITVIAMEFMLSEMLRRHREIHKFS